MAQTDQPAKQTVKVSGVLLSTADQPSGARPAMPYVLTDLHRGLHRASPRLARSELLADEAIRLTRMVQQLLPADAEGGFAASCPDRRGDAGAGPDGDLIPWTSRIEAWGRRRSPKAWR
jgi:hypothetical protein